MAIFHLAHSFVRRSQGRSSLAKSAYNSGKKLEDNEGSTDHSDYTRKGGVLFDEVSLPAGTPAWANERGELWRRLEARENRSTRPAAAVLAHSFDIALPCELTLEQNIYLARDYVREQFTRKGYAVDWAIHNPDPRGDERNIHLHVLAPLRKIEGDSFGNKVHYTKPEFVAQLKGWRSSWANLANRQLQRYGHKARIDERSFKESGTKGTPTRHIGPRRKEKGYILDLMRFMKPPKVTAPIVRPSQDGSSAASNVTPHATFAPTPSGSNNVASFAPSTGVQSKGWPSAAVADWEEWGQKNPPRFFALWPELAGPTRPMGRGNNFAT
jgi:ATP-dependent exoDNAse (exonuclease V) alpha subunit